MWIIRKKSLETNMKWQTIHTTPHKEDCKTVFIAEARLLMEGNASYDRKTIDNRLSYAFNSYGTYRTFKEGNVELKSWDSYSKEHDVLPKRPDRSAILDQILGSKTLCLRPE